MSRWIWLIRYSGLPLCFVLNACLSQNLIKWGEDEVSVVSAWWGEKPYLWSIVIDVQNVAELADGRYYLPILDVRQIPESHEGEDGIQEVEVSRLDKLDRKGPIPYSDFFVDSWDIWKTELTVLDANSIRNPDLQTLLRNADNRGTNWPPDFGIRLSRNDAREYVLEVFAFDAKTRQQWVRIGKCPIGRGTQSRFLRKTAVIGLMPFAFTLDLVLMPVYAIRNQGQWGCCCGPIPL